MIRSATLQFTPLPLQLFVVPVAPRLTADEAVVQWQLVLTFTTPCCPCSSSSDSWWSCCLMTACPYLYFSFLVVSRLTADEAVVQWQLVLTFTTPCCPCNSSSDSWWSRSSADLTPELSSFNITWTKEKFIRKCQIFFTLVQCKVIVL